MLFRQDRTDSQVVKDEEKKRKILKVTVGLHENIV